MNLLFVGTKSADLILAKLEELYRRSGHFLLIDDGPIIDQFVRRTRRKYTELDFSKYSFNPLAGMNDLRAEEFVAIIDALFPEGATTLTRKNSNHLIFKTLKSKPRTLETLFQKLVPANPKDTDFKDAAQKIERILLVDVLRRVFQTRQNFTVRGILLARINRAELGDFTSKALAYFLIARYTGQVVIPAFGKYGRSFHLPLIDQDRLIAGVNHLSESDLRNDLLLIKDRKAGGCLPEDAEILASFKGLRPGVNEFNTEVETSIK